MGVRWSALGFFHCKRGSEVVFGRRQHTRGVAGYGNSLRGVGKPVLLRGVVLAAGIFPQLY